MSVDEAVGALRPFEYDVGAVAFVECEEASVEGSAFLFEDSDDDLAACVAEFFYARAIDFGERVAASDDDAGDALGDDEAGAGWCLAVVGAGFEGDVDGALGEEFGVSDGGYGVDLGVGASAGAVEAFADDASGVDDDGSDHGVGGGVPGAASGELEAAGHVSFVGGHERGGVLKRVWAVAASWVSWAMRVSRLGKGVMSLIFSRRERWRGAP